MRILYVGQMNGISNTCLHRSWALQKYSQEMDVVDTHHPLTFLYRLAYHLFLYGLPLDLPDQAGANLSIKKMVSEIEYDIVWIDKGVTIYPQTLKYIKERQPKAKLISYSPDNMALRHNQSQQYLGCVPLYDYLITTKSYIIDELRKLGAKNVIFVNNAFERRFHKLYDISQNDRLRLKADVGFVGSFEKDRCNSILYLADHGIKVTVWGAGRHWRKYRNYSNNLIIHEDGLYSEDYGKSFQCIKISLCFLKKMNFDQQTQRSVEIPACGGFMLAERTNEHMRLFKEDMEAVFFSSNEELLEKCRYYLAHDEERQAIVKAGHQRCIESDYSNEGMVRRVLDVVMNDAKQTGNEKDS